MLKRGNTQTAPHLCAVPCNNGRKLCFLFNLQSKLECITEEIKSEKLRKPENLLNFDWSNYLIIKVFADSSPVHRLINRLTNRCSSSSPCWIKLWATFTTRFKVSACWCSFIYMEYRASLMDQRDRKQNSVFGKWPGGLSGLLCFWLNGPKTNQNNRKSPEKKRVTREENSAQVSARRLNGLKWWEPAGY